MCDPVTASTLGPPAVPAVPAGEKWCKRCREIKPVWEFYRDRSRPDARRYCCRDCFKLLTKQRKALLAQWDAMVGL